MDMVLVMKDTVVANMDGEEKLLITVLMVVKQNLEFVMKLILLKIKKI